MKQIRLNCEHFYLRTTFAKKFGHCYFFPGVQDSDQKIFYSHSQAIKFWDKLEKEDQNKNGITDIVSAKILC